MATLKPPGDVDDFIAHPGLRATFDALWTKKKSAGGRYLGRYLDEAVARSVDYVDPRAEPPTTDPVKIPWNGFPRLMSRWFDDETSVAAREAAEEAADVLMPIVAWVMPDEGKLELFEVPEPYLPFYAARWGPDVIQLARPRKTLTASGQLGADVPRFRRQQDEYLEWHATTDAAGKLIALTFTAEPPDYWMALAETSPDLVVERYRDLLGNPAVPKSDLFYPENHAVFGKDLDGQLKWFNLGNKGEYDELNPWTTSRGIVHLTHGANTLGAEVFLAADASLAWDAPAAQVGGPAAELLRIACGRYGGVNRSSDPLIGQGVGSAIAEGARVTLSDPIGLYIAQSDLSSLKGPAGQPVGAALKVLRGVDDPFDPRIVRFEVRVPEALGFALGDCSFEGRKLRRGGQIARQTTMHIYAQTYPDSAADVAKSCEGKVCRHPDREELFLIGGVGSPCPDAAGVAWLLQTPLVPSAGFALAGAGGPTAAASNLAREAIPAEAASAAAVAEEAFVRPPVLATSRAAPILSP